MWRSRRQPSRRCSSTNPARASAPASPCDVPDVSGLSMLEMPCEPIVLVQSMHHWMWYLDVWHLVSMHLVSAGNRRHQGRGPQRALAGSGAAQEQHYEVLAAALELDVGAACACHDKTAHGAALSSGVTMCMQLCFDRICECSHYTSSGSCMHILEFTCCRSMSAEEKDHLRRKLLDLIAEEDSQVEAADDAACGILTGNPACAALALHACVRQFWCLLQLSRGWTEWLPLQMHRSRCKSR